MQNAQVIYLQTIEALLEENEIDKALDALLELDKQAQAGIRQDVILQSGNYKEAEKAFQRGFLSFEEYARQKARLRYALTELMKEVPRRLELNAQIQGLGTFKFQVPDEARLEKIIGPKNNLLKINWLEKAMKASKAVCRVVCEDGNLGTGFLTKEGYIFTNNHVLSSKEVVAKARIEFNYEMDSSGSIRSRATYKLDPQDFITSTPDQFDFARVKVIDNPSNPLSNWGHVEFDPGAIPSVGEAVTIIQHPNGQDKQIALNANDVLSVWNQHVFYTTDTEPGSSGSPVFNKDWKVVAIHHAGKTDAEGGLQINAKGERKGANRGILIGEIFDFIKNGNASGGSGRGSGHESFSGAPSASASPVSAPQNQPVTPTTTSIPAGIPKFVVLYDLADEAHAKTLNKHLAVLKFTKKITVFNVHADVKPGEDPEARADEEIPGARLVIALVTANIFNSEAWFGRLLAARETGKTVVPILIEKTDFAGTGLEKLKSLPSLGRWVSDFPNPESAWADIVENLKRAI